MTEPPYLFGIALLLPLSALLTVLQKNPYNALISRGVLGAVSALVYAAFGAADVAVTEALMGSLLTIVLYSIAVRSSLVIRLGVVSPAGPLPASIEAVKSAIQDASRAKHLRFQIAVYQSPGSAIDGLRQGDSDLIIGAFDEMARHGASTERASIAEPGRDAPPVLLYRPAGLEPFLKTTLEEMDVIISGWRENNQIPEDH